MKLVNISTEIRDMAELLKSSLPASARLTLDLVTEIPAVEADPGQLQQVVMNLVLNAGHALEGAADAIRIRSGVTSLLEDELRGLEPAADRNPGRYVYLEVEDHGCGIEDEVLGRIFDPFFTTRHEGHGLAAVLGIVRAHGGGVRVATRPGKGTSFQVFFPASKALILTPKPAPRREQKSEVYGVALVVDDEELVRHMAGEILRSLDWNVIEAASGEEGIETFCSKGAGVRFCLLDMNMPGLGGEETLRAMRELRSDFPILLTSGYSEDSVTRLLTLERTEFLAKPYSIAALSIQLGKLLEADQEVT